MLPHDVLGVRPGAASTEVRAAFRRYASAHHPDRGGDAEAFRVGVEAYRRLRSAPAPVRPDAEVVFHRRRRGLGLPGRRRQRRFPPHARLY